MRPLDGRLSARRPPRRPAVALAVSTPMADAAFFDLDKTIIAGSSALAFSRPFLRRGLDLAAGHAPQRVRAARSCSSGADESTMDRMRRQHHRPVRRVGRRAGPSVVEQTLHEIVEPLVYAEARR